MKNNPDNLFRIDDIKVGEKTIGSFVFRRRNFRDEFKIGAEYSRLTEGVETPTGWLHLLSTAVSTLKVLTEEAPDGWNIDAMDPADIETYNTIMEVYGRLATAEARFRSGSGMAGKAGGQTDGGDGGPVVSPAISPAPE